MPKNNVIKFVVTKEEKEQIKLRAKINGYKTMSAYVRAVAINNDFLIKFNQMYSKIIENGTKKRKNS